MIITKISTNRAMVLMGNSPAKKGNSVCLELHVNRQVNPASADAQTYLASYSKNILELLHDKRGRAMS